MGTGLMAIGSILTDLKNPETPLNFSSETKVISPELPKNTFDETLAVRLVLKDYVSKNSGAELSVGLLLWLAPLVLVDAEAKVDASRSLENYIEALGVKGKIILLDTAREYVKQALGLQKLDHVAKNWVHAPLFYLIVGLATCKSLRRTTVES